MIHRESPITRRTLLRAAGAGAVGVAAGPWFLRRSHADGVIKIGHINSFSGVAAGIGQSGRWGLQVALQRIEQEGGINGMKVEVIEADSAFDSSKAAIEAEKMILRHNVDFVTGISGSHECVKIAPLMAQHKTLFILGTGCETPALTADPNCNRGVFRPYNSTRSQAIAMAQWAVKHVGKKWFGVYSDFAWGQSVFETFKTEIGRVGGTTVGSIAPPLRTNDFQPYLTRLDTSADGLVMALVGGDAVRILQQMASMGVTRKLKIVGPASLVDITTLPAQKDAAVGTYTLHRYPSLSRLDGTPFDDEVNRRFFADFRRVSNGALPSGYSQAQHTGLNLIKQTIKATGWKSRDDHMKIIEWLENGGKGRLFERGHDFPQGEFFLRAEDHQGFTDHFMVTVNDKIEYELVGGRVGWKETLYPSACTMLKKT